ncbi:MAG: ABC transporter permease [Chloroflexota bacterium]|nr:MAG: ABC transporter permease [Chloroflexota bacterium]
MAAFIVRRLLTAIPLLLGISMVLFVLIHLPPGGPADIYAGSPTASAADLARMNENLGLNDPLPVQYVKWLRGMVTGDWGVSYKDGRPVTTAILERLPATIQLMLTSLLIAVALAIPIGVFTATRAQRGARYVVNVFTMLGISVPTFWTGLMVIMIFAGRLGWIPAGGRGRPDDLLSQLHHLIGPALVLALVSMAGFARYIHSSMVEVMQEDYVRTATAKGLARRTVVFRHAFRNASIPLITLIGLELPRLISGALVTEVVFSWPGLGRLITESILARNYPVLMGAFMLIALMTILGSLIADVGYGLVNPQIRTGERR